MSLEKKTVSDYVRAGCKKKCESVLLDRNNKKAYPFTLAETVVANNQNLTVLVYFVF